MPQLDIGANTRAAQNNVKDLSKALDGVADSLDDVARDGDRSGDKLERTFRGMVTAAKRSADDTGDAWKKAYKRAEDAADDFNARGSENVQNFKQEAVQNFSEVASSWQGDLEGMADGVQGLTGGLASSLTPGIGIPVAILGAAAAAFFASWVDAAENSKQQVSDMYNDFIESGKTFVSENYIATAIQDIQEDTDKWNDALARNRDTGVEIGTVLRAMAGDQNAIAEVHGVYVAQRDEELEKIRRSGKSIEEQAIAVDGVNAKFGEQVEWIGQVQRNTSNAADKAAAYRDAMGGAADNAARVRDIVGQIQDRNITVGVSVNNAAFENWWRTVQNRAAQGITVNARPGQGRFWE